MIDFLTAEPDGEEHPCPICFRPGLIYKPENDDRSGILIAHAWRPYIPCRYVPPPSYSDSLTGSAKEAWDLASAFFKEATNVER